MKWATGIVCTTGLIIAASALWAMRDDPASRPGYGGEPVIDVVGHVTDQATGRPIAGAFVIVNMTSYHAVPGTHHGVSGCQRGSTVVRTDERGVYRFHWSWEDQGLDVPDDLSVSLRVYVPSYEYAFLPRGSWIWFPPDERVDFPLRRSTAKIDERTDWMWRLLHDFCPMYLGDRTALPLAVAMYEETWAAYCADAGKTSLREFVTTLHMLSSIESIPYNIIGDDVMRRRREMQEQNSAVWRTLPEIRPDQSSIPDGLSLDSERRQLLCEKLSPSVLRQRWSL